MASDAMSPVDRIYSLVQAMRYRLRLILLVFAIILCASVTFVMRMPNVYRSETQILVDPQRISDKYVSGVVTADASQRLDTLSQQILSSSRLDAIIQEYKLFPKLRDSTSREELIERMRKNIGIQLKHNAEGLSAFSLSYTGESAEEVATVANRLAESFISWNLHDREQEALGTTKFLENELHSTKMELDRLEERLRIYKMEHLGELPDQMQANMQTLARLQVELQANTEAQSRLDHEAILSGSMGTDSSAKRGDTNTPTLRQRLYAERATAQSELAELRRHYTDRFPDVARKQADIRALDERIATLPQARVEAAAAAPDPEDGSATHLQLIRRDRARLESVGRNIEASIQRYQRRIDSEPLREQEISQLSRDYNTTRDHYNVLLEKTYSAQMAAQLEREQQGGSFTMLDRARIPDAPVGPKRVPLLFGSFFAALAASLAVGFLAESMDRTLKSEAELHDCLPMVPVLGTTPNIRPASTGRALTTTTRLSLGGH
ncbi:uncharacterized protein involved in exopolysaccharide biosynthesis [Terriglobus roseus DSM 18391]|uniref:Uncharacterized protein involved in exopolysaccharide biosynthesis n=1 Tax=Terriglobus roseus (strain DSM 18391 / NRRL B-41598 / KBS 63) TaxID=926566 RepID=I3ZE93_TERRK|nr:LPS biosynthesis protein [Terriglobus roseus]AFL87561.1 uncharacterized protein involved in exopolysaccharide biosynthesis [Terriglobus roseus DSM 18391]